MRLSSLATALILVPLSCRAADWTVLDNARFGFTVDVPASYEALPPPANGDGLQFKSKDGRFEATASGHWLGRGFGMIADERQRAAAEEEAHVKLTYQEIADDTYTLSGLKDDRNVYIRAITTCAGKAVALFRLEYPAADKLGMDPVIAHMIATLQRSRRC